MNLLELFAPVRTFVFEADGVLTDGSLLLTEEGHALRTMNARDCYAIQTAVDAGYQVWVIMAGAAEGMRLQLNKLGVQQVHSAIENKKELLNEIITATNTAREKVLYMGNDIPDYAAMQLCGLPCCPADAVPEIKQVSKYISPYSAGKGCVRDVIAKVLKLNGDWKLPE